MILYNFEKPILEVKLIDGTLENVITTVHWRYTGTDENGISAYISSGNTRTKSRNRNFNKQII